MYVQTDAEECVQCRFGMLCAGSDMIAKLMRMQLLEEADVETGASSPDEERRLADGRPAWMRTLHTSVSTWLKLVPQVRHRRSKVSSYFQRWMFGVVCIP